MKRFGDLSNLAARPNCQLHHRRCSRGCRLGLATPRLGDVWISGTLRSRNGTSGMIAKKQHLHHIFEEFLLHLPST